MSENYIKITRTAKIVDEVARQEDKKKAYKIVRLSGISAVILTVLMYFLPELLLTN